MTGAVTARKVGYGAWSCPIRARGDPPRGVLPAQGLVALFPVREQSYCAGPPNLGIPIGHDQAPSTPMHPALTPGLRDFYRDGTQEWLSVHLRRSAGRKQATYPPPKGKGPLGIDSKKPWIFSTTML
jgi:hypothetical protein